MDYSTEQYVLIYAAVLLSSFVQSTTGFAAGLIAIPTLLTAGIELPAAISATMLSATIQNIAGVVRLRADIDWRAIRLPALLRLSCIPLGMVVMFALMQSAVDHRTVMRQVFGLLILLVLAAQRFLHVEPRPSQAQIWSWLAFPTSGFLQGLVGLAGPPMVLWLMAHDWSANRSRGFLFAMFLLGLPLHLGLLLLIWPNELYAGLLISLISLPATLLGTGLGLAAGKRIRRRLLRRLTLMLLVLIAINCFATPWLQEWWGSPAQ